MNLHARLPMDVKPFASVTAAVPAHCRGRFRAARPFLGEAKAGHGLYRGSSFVVVLSLVKLVNNRRTSCRATRDINGMSDLVERGYDGFLLDQYGVLHDGRELLPDVKECLDQLQRRSIPMAIVSNSPCESARAALRLERIGLMNEYFQSLVTSGDQAKRYLEKLISEAAPVRLSCLFISHADHVERGTWSPEELRSMGLELVASVDECDFVLANGVQVCYKGTLSEVESDYESDANKESSDVARHTTMGQEITRFGDECNCFVGSEPDREPAQTPRTVDPVANLVTKEFPKTVLTPPPPTSTKSHQETLQGIEEQLMQIQKSGFHVPMIFLCVAGSSNPQAVQSVQVPEVIAERWIRVVRLMLELQQPIYGMATGTMSPFGIMLLEACDCVLADTVQEGVHANRILKPLEMALVCKVAAEEAESMNDAQLVEHKAKFVRDKLYAYNVNPWMSAEEEEGFFVPPPPPPDPEPYQASEEPPSAEKAPAPAPLPAPETAIAKPKPASSKPSAASPPSPPAAPPRPASAKPKARAEGASGAINFEAMLLDLEGAEEAAFTAAFQSLSDGRTALQPDHDQLRSFILVNSGIGEQDLDTELLKIASAREDFCIDIPGFIALLREHPVSDSDTLTLFMNVSNDGESMTSEDCRTCLLALVAKLPDAHIREDRMEKIFDTVMTSADLSISMEQWMAFAKTTARIIRLMAHAKKR
ncbi:hypothetical protein AK812_SmicGene25681 [Symbiodinium microadriaticum]|uniref:Uncharacterized protein n=2 Tax=Symbiodinium TaxID=2949 RepID=A0A1Q9DBL2_SYMMI|nr:hypothetical protein AK812_SmicGene25681 [Symbiodinium microadriaticum]CAE7226431.1 unnamed protein product [Symbiodinium sp. KB8]CAE7684311.1 unnamed protein product [Symbiodinium microadriaticum]